MRKLSSHHFSAVGAYIFAGGFTLGVGNHFKILAHLENGQFGVATARRNFPELAVYPDPATWPLDELRAARPDLVYCNPPCAAWSRVGTMLFAGADHWRTDERVECVRHCFTLLEKLRPRVWLWESVTEAYRHGRSLVDQLTREAQALGYSVTYLLIDNARLGLPQQRRRFIFVAHDLKIAWEDLPDKRVTVGETLRDVDPGPDPHSPRRGWYADAALLRQVKPGVKVRKVWDELNPNPRLITAKTGRTHLEGRPGLLYTRLRADQPSFTITGGAHYLLPDEDRLLSPVEAQLLCGFPAEYKFVGEAYSQIGKGVSPIMGEWLGRQVDAALRGPQTADRVPVVTELNLLDWGTSVTQQTRRLQPLLFGDTWG